MSKFTFNFSKLIFKIIKLYIPFTKAQYSNRINSLSIIFLVFVFQFLNAQKLSKVISIKGSYTFDLANNFSGGIEKGSAFIGNIDLAFNIDSESLDLWKGGHFFVYLLNNHGNSLSNLIGDFQIANNIEAESHTRLYEVWYKQHFKTWSLLIGQHDLNSVFAIPETGQNFINSSFGIQPDLSSNFPASIFPLATLGIVVNWSLNDQILISHAIYDGDPGSESDNPNSLNWRFNKEEGALLINEIQFQIKKENILKSVYKFGIWNHLQKQILDEVLFSSRNGVYFISDHKLIQNTSNGIFISAFSQIGLSLSFQNPVASFVGGGFWFKGFSSKRAEDGFGIAVANANFSKYYRSQFEGILKRETVIELTYQWIANRKLIFQPNIQYILNPSSTSGLSNALMGLIRFNYAW